MMIQQYIQIKHKTYNQDVGRLKPNFKMATMYYTLSFD
jgi:hypothetical protein